jgi:hypothetical protein
VRKKLSLGESKRAWVVEWASGRGGGVPTRFDYLG